MTSTSQQHAEGWKTREKSPQSSGGELFPVWNCILSHTTMKPEGEIKTFKYAKLQNNELLLRKLPTSNQELKGHK